MSFTYGFYNSLNGDRKYDVEQMSKLFDGLIADGVFATVGEALMVKEQAGMMVTVDTGRAWFDHTWSLNDSELAVTVDISELVLDRLDSLVLEIDATTEMRTNTIKMIKGVPGGTPVRPTLINTELVHQYALANIYVAAGVTEIIQANITNIIGTSETPFVTGVIDTIDVDALLAQWDSEFHTWNDEKKAEFDAWFITIQDILDENVAGNLLNLINANNQPQNIVDQFKQADGAGSGTDADMLDGKHGSEYTTNEDFGVINDRVMNNTMDIQENRAFTEYLGWKENNGGNGSFETFKSTVYINMIDTTAEINTVDRKCIAVGSQILKMKVVEFLKEYRLIRINFFGNYRRATVTDVVSPTQIRVETSGAPLDISDKLSFDNEAVGFTDIEGSQSVVTYDTSIPNSDNNTTGKNAVMFNGNRHTVVSTATGLELRVASKPTKVADISTDVTTKFSVAVVSEGGNEYLFVTWGTATEQKIKGYDIAYAVVQAEIVGDTLTSIFGVDLHSNSNKLGFVNRGFLPSSPTFINARGSEFTISANGSLTLDRTVEQITDGVKTVQDIHLFYHNNVMCLVYNDNSELNFIIRDNSLDAWASIDANWTYKQIVTNASTPIGVGLTKSNGLDIGRIAIVRTSNSITVLTISDDNGLNWDTQTITTCSNPQLTENLAGDIHITYEDAGAIKTQVIPNGSDVPNVDGYVLNYDFTQDATVDNIEDRVGLYDTTSTGLTKVTDGFEGSATAEIDTGFLNSNIGAVNAKLEFKRNNTSILDTEYIYSENAIGTSGIDIVITPLGEARFIYRINGGLAVDLVTPVISDDVFRRYELRWDGTTGTNAVEVYIDDVLSVSGTSSTAKLSNVSEATIFYKTSVSGVNNRFKGVLKNLSVSLGTANNTNPLPTEKYVDTLVPVEESNKLYEVGNEFIPTTGGWVNGYFTGGPTVNKLPSSIEIICPTTLVYNTVTDLPIDLTNVDSVGMEVEFPTTVGLNWVQIRVSTTKSDDTEIVQGVISTTVGGKYFIVADTSALVGNHYIKGRVNPTNATTLKISRVYMNIPTNPKTDGRATDYVKPICTYQSGTSVKLAGEESIGGNYLVTLEKVVSTTVGQSHGVTTQYGPTNPNIDTATFVQQTDEYLSYELSLLANSLTTELEIICQDTEIEYMCVGII